MAKNEPFEAGLNLEETIGKVLASQVIPSSDGRIVLCFLTPGEVWYAVTLSLPFGEELRDSLDAAIKSVHQKSG